MYFLDLSRPILNITVPIEQASNLVQSYPAAIVEDEEDS